MKHEKRIPARGPLALSVVDDEGLQRLDPGSWDALSGAALVENPYYSRQYVLAGIETIDRATPLQALLVRSADATLLGLFPFLKIRKAPFPFHIARGAAHMYQSSGIPLVHRAHAQAVVAAWLDAAGRAPELPRFWLLPHIDLDAPFAALLRDGATAGKAALPVVPYPRPRLTRLDGGFQAHLASVLSKSRRKDIQRNLRRLEEQGEVRFERAREPEVVRQRLEQFLTLEHSGWKGEQGTSFLAKARDTDFARRAFGGAPGREGLTSIDSLLLDGRPIAMSVNLCVSGVAFAPKCAYDETLRKYSPGLVLEYLVIKAFYEEPSFQEMDASTTQDGHVVLGLWNERKAMAQLVVGPRHAATELLAQICEQRYALKQGAKQLLKRLNSSAPFGSKEAGKSSNAE